MFAFFNSCFSTAEQHVMRDIELKQQDPNPSLIRKWDKGRGKQEFEQELKIVPNKFTVKGALPRRNQRISYESVGIKEQKYNNFLSQVRKDPGNWNKIFEEENANYLD